MISWVAQWSQLEVFIASAMWLYAGRTKVAGLVTSASKDRWLICLQVNAQVTHNRSFLQLQDGRQSWLWLSRSECHVICLALCEKTKVTLVAIVSCVQQWIPPGCFLDLSGFFHFETWLRQLIAKLVRKVVWTLFAEYLQCQMYLFPAESEVQERGTVKH